MFVFCYPSLGCKIKMKESVQVVAKDMLPTRFDANGDSMSEYTVS